MTPKEKAKDLFNRLNYKIHSASGYYREQNDLKNCAKDCALICVDEILNEYWSHDTKRRDWWQQVRTEIEKL